MTRPFATIATMSLIGAIAYGTGDDEKKSVYEMEPYTVSAFRYDQDIWQTPVNADVILREDIVQSGAATVVDVLEDQVGILFRSSSGNASQAEPSLRGFGENSGQRVLVLIDGQKLNRPDMGQLEWSSIPLSEIESIEVLRGPQTALYGNHAVGGVIKITTKSDTTRPTGTVTAIAGSYGLYNLRGSFMVPVGKTRLKLTGETNTIDGYRQNSAYEADSAGASLSFNLTEKVSGRSSITYTEADYDFPGPVTKTDFLTNPRVSYAMDNGGISKIWLIDNSLTWSASDRQTVEVSAGLNERNLAWNLDGVYGDNLMQGATISPQYRYEVESWTFLTGIDVFLDQLDFLRFPDGRREAVIGDAELERQLYGLYAHLRYNLNDNWIASASLRGEKAEMDAQNIDYNEFEPHNYLGEYTANSTDEGIAASLGLTWLRTETNRFWGRVDRLYRYPALDEIAAYQGYPLQEPFNEHLAAEEGWNVEIGSSLESAPWSASISLFSMFLEGEIAFDYTQNLNVNMASTIRYGAEIEGQYTQELWWASLSYTALAAENTSGPYDGKDVYMVPAHTLQARAGWTPDEKFELEVVWAYTSEQWQGNDLKNELDRLDAYHTLDAIIHFRPRNDIDFFVRADNLYDHHYATLRYSGVYYPAPGATIRAGATYSF